MAPSRMEIVPFGPKPVCLLKGDGTSQAGVYRVAKKYKKESACGGRGNFRLTSSWVLNSQPQRTHVNSNCPGKA